MATAKTTTLTFRIEPNLKDALRTASERDHRSIANMIEVMIRDYCARVRVDACPVLRSCRSMLRAGLWRQGEKYYGGRASCNTLY